jgi:hypothetical protein
VEALWAGTSGGKLKGKSKKGKVKREKYKVKRGK